MNIRKFNSNDIEAAGRLLAQRHMEERRIFPSLKAKYDSCVYAENIIKELINTKNCIAICAYTDNKMLGYIISHVKNEHVFGRCSWVKYEGMAIDKSEDGELYRKLYAHIANLWIDAGCLMQYVFVPTGKKENVDAWLNLGFAFQQAYGIAKASKSNIKLPKNINIRQAIKSDADDLKAISNLIMSYQAKSPTFAAGLPEEVASIKKGYASLAQDDEATVLLAYDKEKLMGFQCSFEEENDDLNMMVPDNSCEISVGGTVNKHQGTGIGTILVNELQNRAIKSGKKNLYTDWRITNLKSSVFWPNRGFDIVAYRMVRQIDNRVYWADGFNEI